MKWLVIFLLLINVFVYGWQFNKDVREEAAVAAGVAPLPADAPSLRLVSELDELPPSREAVAAPTASLDADAATEVVAEAVDLTTEINSVGDASEVCVNVGPLKDSEALEKLKLWLRTRATVVHTQMDTVRERRFFWVYLEPVSDEQAKKDLSELERSGITDYMLIRRGGLKNAISLGLFRSQDSVNRRLTEMTRKGYKPVVVPKFETLEHYQVRAIMAKGFEDITDVSAEVLGESELRQIDCTGLADATVAGEA